MQVNQDYSYLRMKCKQKVKYFRALDKRIKNKNYVKYYTLDSAERVIKREKYTFKYK